MRRTHRRKGDTRTQAQRGYGADHKREREAQARIVASGVAHCWRCGRHVPPGAPWHLGHDDWDRSITRGVECVRCNLSAAARKRNLIARLGRDPAQVQRDW
jgi:hypothetical protein